MNIEQQIYFFCHLFIWWFAITIVSDAAAWRSKDWNRILYGE